MAIPLTIQLGSEMKWTDRIGRRVKLRDLHIALAVAEAGSMTRAAEELAVSYPVVSKTISELEHTLGVKLFDRSISGVEPTHYGRALLKSGVAVFDEMRKGLQEIEFIKQPDAGELRIGSSIVTDAGLLPAIIERFSQDFPRAVLHVLPENIATQQYDNLRDRKVELVFGRLPATMSEPDLVAEPLFDEPTVVAAGSESRWAKRRNLTLADLMGEPWVLAQPGSLARSLHDEVFRKSGVEPPSATGTDGLAPSLHAPDRNGTLAWSRSCLRHALWRQANAHQGSAGQSARRLPRRSGSSQSRIAR